MVGTVIDGDLEIHHGVSGQEALFGRFHDALFHGGDEVLGDGAAENLIGELELCRRAPAAPS